MFAHGIEAEEHLRVVDQVKLEEWHGRTDPDLGVRFFDEAKLAELIDRVDNGFSVALHDPSSARTESRAIGHVLDT